MGRHSIKVKITLLLTVIITSLIVLLLILNSTLSEKFYFSDKQECMLNTYSKINQIMNDYDAGTVSESQMSDSIEQLTGSAAMSVIVVNSDWTTVYSNINGEQDMINRLLRSIFNKDVFGTSDSAPQRIQTMKMRLAICRIWLIRIITIRIKEIQTMAARIKIILRIKTIFPLICQTVE